MKRAQNDGYVWRGLVIYGDHILAYLTGPPKNRFSLGLMAEARVRANLTRQGSYAPASWPQSLNRRVCLTESPLLSSI